MIQTLLKRSDLDYATFTDSVNKFRVSTPESLIDTDFEYGLQSIKWETIMLVNNIPLFFSRSGDTPTPLTNVRATLNSDYIYVTTSVNHNLIDGAPFYISGLKSITAEGYFLVSKVLSNQEFVYKAKYNQTISGSLFDANTSYLFPSMVYQGTCYTADQLQSAESDKALPSTITVNTTAPHGFKKGTNFALSGTVARRQVVFRANRISANTITTDTNHGFYNTMRVVYTKGVGADIANLVVNTEYFVFNATATTLQLVSSIGSTTPLTIGTSSDSTNDYFLTSIDDASDGSTYVVDDVPSSNTFTLKSNPYAGSIILPNVLTMANFRSNIIQSSAANGSVFLFNTEHKAVTGTKVTYRTTSGTNNFNNLVDGTYYIVRENQFAFKLTRSLENALAKTNFVSQQFEATAVPSTTSEFEVNSILGEVRGSGVVTCSNLQNIVTGTNVNFLSFFKKGDVFKIVPPIPTEIVYNVNSVVSGVFNLNTLNGIQNGTPLRYTGVTTVSGFSSGMICYAGAVNTANTSIKIYSQYDRAIAGSTDNITAISDTGSVFRSVLLSSNITSIFESRISTVNNSSMITLETPNNTGINFINANYMVSSTMFPFSDSYVYHRAHDGGIEMNPSNNPDAQIIRQTRKYFRYQPGKGIQCSLSVNFNAPIEIDILTRTGTTATVRTRKPHRMSNGLQIRITGALDPAWNSTFTVLDTPEVNTFRFIMTSVPVETTARGYPVFTVLSWKGSSLRAGLFDDQNGMFFEYNGSSIFAVRRDSVTQLSGLVNVTFRSGLVTKTQETTTLFLSQLAVNDYIVIRGQTYRVVFIENDSTLYIQPPYRGVTDQNVLVSRVVDTRVPQSNWSVDKCDGTGPTGYLLDINKIQMIYMDYSWYGAGKIRFGFKDKKGEVRYVHEFIHNNNSSTAYFRSGNLPARYEVCNSNVVEWVPPLLHWGTAIIMDGRYDDDKAYLFTASGNVLNYSNGDQIRISGSTLSTTQTLNVYDPYIQRTTSAFYIQSSGAGNNTWSAVQNLKSGTLVTSTNNALPNNTFTLGTPQKDNTNPLRATIYINKAPSIVVANDTLSFTFGDINDIIPNNIPLVSVRVAPSVDSSITGPLGVRELITRMQLRLRSVDILTTNDTEMRLILNGFISNRSFVNAPSPSLSQYIAHNKGDTIQDGTVLFSYRVPGGVFDSSGKRTSTVTSYDLSGIGFLGNSISGGDNIYPDGPDVLTLVAVCLDPAGVSATTPYTVSARISWAEAQA